MVLSRTVHEESAWMISASTLLRAGSTYRNKMLLLPVDFGGGGPRRIPGLNDGEKGVR